jgi:hypothetical protein
MRDAGIVIQAVLLGAGSGQERAPLTVFIFKSIGLSEIASVIAFEIERAPLSAHPDQTVAL